MGLWTFQTRKVQAMVGSMIVPSDSTRRTGTTSSTAPRLLLPLRLLQLPVLLKPLLLLSAAAAPPAAGASSLTMMTTTTTATTPQLNTTTTSATTTTMTATTTTTTLPPPPPQRSPLPTHLGAGGRLLPRTMGQEFGFRV